MYFYNFGSDSSNFIFNSSYGLKKLIDYEGNLGNMHIKFYEFLKNEWLKLGKYSMTVTAFSQDLNMLLFQYAIFAPSNIFLGKVRCSSLELCHETYNKRL